MTSHDTNLPAVSHGEKPLFTHIVILTQWLMPYLKIITIRMKVHAFFHSSHLTEASMYILLFRYNLYSLLCYVKYF